MTKNGRKKEYGEAALSLHRKIKTTIEEMSSADDVSCVVVSSLERKLGKDPRTVVHHLKLLEEAEYGKLTKDGKLFCKRK